MAARLERDLACLELPEEEAAALAAELEEEEATEEGETEEENVSEEE